MNYELEVNELKRILSKFKKVEFESNRLDNAFFFDLVYKIIDISYNKKNDYDLFFDSSDYFESQNAIYNLKKFLNYICDVNDVDFSLDLEKRKIIKRHLDNLKS